jgi:uncharacterized repeat protein (TIGR01451 family)
MPPRRRTILVAALLASGFALAVAPAAAAAADTDADIAIRLVPTQGPIYAGQPFFMSVEMANNGPASATGITAVVRLPAGLSVVSGAACTPDGGGTVCVFGPFDRPPHTGDVAVVTLTASAAGSYTVFGTITANEVDPLPTNNVSTATIMVLSSADLTVAVAGPAEANPGKAVTYTVTVTNSGPSPAASVALTDRWTATLAGGVRLLSAETTQGTCARAGDAVVACDLGAIAAGASATITVGLHPRGVGTLTNQARATAADDPDPANNVDSVTTTIG